MGKTVDFEKWVDDTTMAEFDKTIASLLDEAKETTSVEMYRKAVVDEDKVNMVGAATETLVGLTRPQEVQVTKRIGKPFEFCAGIDMEGHTVRLDDMTSFATVLNQIDSLEVENLTNGDVRIVLGFANILRYPNEPRGSNAQHKQYTNKRIVAMSHAHHTESIVLPLVASGGQRKRTQTLCQYVNSILNKKVDDEDTAEFQVSRSQDKLLLQMDLGFGLTLVWEDGTMGTFLDLIQLVDSVVFESLDDMTTRVTLEVLLQKGVRTDE